MRSVRNGEPSFGCLSHGSTIFWWLLIQVTLKLNEYDLNSWRLMHIGAQPVPPALVQHWLNYFPNMAYDNNYGLSESTGPGSVHLGLENEFRAGAVGKVGCGWHLKIVTEDDRDIPPG